MKWFYDLKVSPALLDIIVSDQSQDQVNYRAATLDAEVQHAQASISLAWGGKIMKVEMPAALCALPGRHMEWRTK